MDNVRALEWKGGEDLMKYMKRFNLELTFLLWSGNTAADWNLCFTVCVNHMKVLKR